MQDITGDDLGSIDFTEGAITKNGGLEGERLLQFFDDGTGLKFLDETDGGVEQQQSADDTEIDPIFETGSQDGGGLN